MRKSSLNNACLTEKAYVSKSATLTESALCSRVKILNTGG
jgi:hypothetical protein